jgi:hypothetical protein
MATEASMCLPVSGELGRTGISYRRREKSEKWNRSREEKQYVYIVGR